MKHVLVLLRVNKTLLRVILANRNESYKVLLYLGGPYLASRHITPSAL